MSGAEHLYTLTHKEKLDAIIEWAEEVDKFDTRAIEGISDSYKEWNRFTEYQMIAIDNVWKRWRLEAWYDKHHG
jgi:hypothetical protein